MKKYIRGIGAIIAGCMLLTDTVAAAGAEPAITSETVSEAAETAMASEADIMPEAAGDDGADIFDSLYETRGRDIAGRERIVYDRLSAFAKDVAEGKRASAVLELTPEDLEMGKEYSLSDLNVTEFMEGGILSEATQSALESEMSFDLGKVTEALLADDPYALYWFDEDHTDAGGNSDAATVAFTFGGTVSEDEDILTLDDTSKISVRLMVSKDYSATDAAGTSDVNRTKTGNASKAAKEKANAIVTAAAGVKPALTDLGKLNYYMTKIMELVVSDRDPGDPGVRRLADVFAGDGTTRASSEGYARAFKYLCDLTTFGSNWTAASIVTGTVQVDGGAAEKHMWNLVQMNDGKGVYLADLSLCATAIGASGEYPGGLFMVGNAAGSTSGGYTFSLNEGNHTAVYRYDSATVKLFDEDELKLAAADYNQEAAAVADPGKPVTGVKLTSEDAKTKEMNYRLNMDAPKPLNVTITPADAADQDFTITSSNEGAATVEATESAVTLSLAGVGFSKLTVTTNDGNFSDYLRVTVRYATPSASEQGDLLGGLEAEGTYSIAVGKGTPVSYTADENGQIEIQEEWRSKSINIIRTHAVYDSLNSDAQTLKIGRKAAAYDPESGVTISWEDPEDEYTYTGQKIKPRLTVYNEVQTFAEGKDYVVKYKKNTNVGDAVVIVKAAKKSKNLSKKFRQELSFKIVQKDIGDGIEAPDIYVDSGKKARPFLLYGKKALTADKDFEYDKSVKYSENGIVTVKGIGNFTGEILVNVIIRTEKAKKLKAREFKGEDYEPLVYDGSEQYPDVTVYDPAEGMDEDKMPEKVLTQGTDYLIGWPMNCTDAGTHKYTIYGIGEYAGSVTKTYKIQGAKLWASKEDIDWPTNMEKDEDTGKIEYDEFPYMPGGTTLDDDDSLFGLEKDTDYTITYSKNKKRGLATYKIKFKKNYGKTKPLTGKFKIVKASLGTDAQAALILPPQYFDGNDGTYAATPYAVCDDENGSMLKKGKDFTIRYFRDQKHSADKEITAQNPITAAEFGDTAGITIYALATGKGNYDPESSIAGTYTLYRTPPAEPAIDLGKDVRVTCKSVTYKGVRIEPSADLIASVEIRTDGVWSTLTGDELENFKESTTVDFACANNLKVGKAKLIITGKNTPVASTPFFYGGKMVKFKITRSGV